MSNHLWRATLRTASSALIEHAGQKVVEYENGDGGLVDVNFEVADVTRPLVAVGGLQKRGLTMVMGPHGRFVTRGQVMKPPGSNLDLEHPNGACWMRLTRGENGTSTVALVDLGDAVPTSKDLSGLPSVVDTIDVARETQKQTCLRRWLVERPLVESHAALDEGVLEDLRCDVDSVFSGSAAHAMCLFVLSNSRTGGGSVRDCRHRSFAAQEHFFKKSRKPPNKQPQPLVRHEATPQFGHGDAGRLAFVDKTRTSAAGRG